MPKGLFWVGLVAVMTLASGAAAENRLDVLLLAERFPGSDATFVDALRSTLEARGFAVKSLGADALVPELSAKSGRARLLVLPNSACFPVEARQALLDYLKTGGNLLTIGGPPLSRQVIRLNGE